MFDGGENSQINLTVMRVGRCVCLTTVSVGRSVCFTVVRVGRAVLFIVTMVGRFVLYYNDDAWQVCFDSQW